MKTYYKSIEEFKYGRDLPSEKTSEQTNKNAVLDMLDSKVTEATASRRDFLKLFGFSFATAAIVSSCEKPVQKAIPYLIKPEEVTPGQASYYASTFFDGTEYAGILVKVRDGRPIKIEGNSSSPISKGATSARIQASVLNLYDEARYKGPLVNGKKADWDEVDERIIGRLNSGNRSVLLTTAWCRDLIRSMVSIRFFLNPGLIFSSGGRMECRIRFLK